MTQIISLISHISFSCIEKVIDTTVGRQKVKRVEMCLLPDFVVWWSHAEKAAPPQPSRSYWEPSHRDRNVIFTTSRLIWSVYSRGRLEDSLLRMFKSVISGLREFECYSQSCLSSYHLPSPAALGPCRYRQKQADSQTSRQVVVQSDRQVVVQSDRQTGGRSVRQVPVQWGDEPPGAVLLLQQPADSSCLTVLTRSEDHRLQHVHLEHDDGENVSD